MGRGGRGGEGGEGRRKEERGGEEEGGREGEREGERTREGREKRRGGGRKAYVILPVRTHLLLVYLQHFGCLLLVVCPQRSNGVILGF